ncbi:hypothetical protein NAV31_04605 [Pseudomonas stutzeri]|uniref:hypothetical protein n=1 Tax=Pseudomonas TaxID=286 RepID=UPI001F46348A|nr:MULTISPECIES: hypothetical protein [Pseudomonas]MCQ4232971.1 hypothetical protein [Stutzerimonas degradans]UIP87467.1 hypothetical protein HU825_13300 [Pseudomonas phenolilytica]
MRVHLLLAFGVVWWASAATAQSDGVSPERATTDDGARETETVVKGWSEADKAPDEASKRLAVPLERNAGEPGHGGNETDMVHHRRELRDKFDD